MVALARRDTNRVAVAGISPGLSVSETPGLGVAGGIIHIYRVAVAAKQPMGVRQTTDGGCGETTDGGCGETTDGGCGETTDGGCGETTNGGCGETTNGGAAKQPTGAWQNNRRGRGETTNGGAIRVGYYRCGCIAATATRLVSRLANATNAVSFPRLADATNMVGIHQTNQRD